MLSVCIAVSVAGSVTTTRWRLLDDAVDDRPLLARPRELPVDTPRRVAARRLRDRAAERLPDAWDVLNGRDGDATTSLDVHSVGGLGLDRLAGLFPRDLPLRPPHDRLTEGRLQLLF